MERSQIFKIRFFIRKYLFIKIYEEIERSFRIKKNIYLKQSISIILNKRNIFLEQFIILNKKNIYLEISIT